MEEAIYTMVRRFWELHVLRLLLVEARNKIVDKPFFLWRFWLKKPLARIDEKLDAIDVETRRLRVRLHEFRSEKEKRGNLYGKKSSYV